MVRPLKAIASSALALALILAGCGGSGSKSQSSSAQVGSASQTSSGPQTSTSTASRVAARTSRLAPSAQAPKASGPKEHIPKDSILVSSPVFKARGTISSRYTCDGADTSPPVHWSGIPSGTAEIVLFFINLEGHGGRLPIYWAVAGLQSTLKGIPAGMLAPGAVVGRNSQGQSRYSICPAKGSGVQHYLVVVFALQHPVSVKPGFSGPALYNEVENTAEYKGIGGFSYKRA